MKSVHYIERNLQNLPKIQFQMEFPQTAPEVVQTLHSMLEFNPFFRKSAGELLSSKVFAGVRSKEMEKPASEKIELDIDKLGAFDYRLGDIKYNMADLKQMVAKEVKLAKRV